MLNPVQYVERVNEAVRYIKRTLSDFHPIFALVLGSGLGKLTEEIEILGEILYKDIPHFPTTTVVGHEGKMIFGFIKSIPIIGLSGRKHYYEVVDDPLGIYQVVFPVHVMASLGVKIYFPTNAVGGLNLTYEKGDLMVVTDHIDLHMPDPIIGPHLDFGDNPYFQNQKSVYNEELAEAFFAAAEEVGEKDRVQEGILTARTGRTYESPATSRVLRAQGADAVGMSVIPEVIAAHNRGMKVIAVSLITNIIDEDGTNGTSHEEVTEASENCQRMAKVVSKFFELIHKCQLENADEFKLFINS